MMNHSQTAPLFRSILGQAWNLLPQPVQDFHEVIDQHQYAGYANVSGSRNWAARMLRTLLSLPEAGLHVPLKVTVISSGWQEKWIRNFAGRSFYSIFSLGHGHYDGLIVERLGPFTAGLALDWHKDKLQVRVQKCALWFIPLPALLMPYGDCYECSREERFCFNIEIRLPVIGLLVKYSGYLLEC